MFIQSMRSYEQQIPLPVDPAFRQAAGECNAAGYVDIITPFDFFPQWDDVREYVAHLIEDKCIIREPVYGLGEDQRRVIEHELQDNTSLARFYETAYAFVETLQPDPGILIAQGEIITRLMQHFFSSCIFSPKWREYLKAHDNLCEQYALNNEYLMKPNASRLLIAIGALERAVGQELSEN